MPTQRVENRDEKRRTSLRILTFSDGGPPCLTGQALIRDLQVEEAADSPLVTFDVKIRHDCIQEHLPDPVSPASR